MTLNFDALTLPGTRVAAFRRNRWPFSSECAPEAILDLLRDFSPSLGAPPVSGKGVLDGADEHGSGLKIVDQ